MRTVAIILVLGAALFGGATYSKAASQEPADEILKFYFARSYTPSDRINLAKLYAAYCRGRLDATPTNTPTEAAWVAAEGATTNTVRIGRLLGTKEWARQQLKETFSDCLSKVELLQQAQAQKARDAEAAQFISLALTFNSSDLRTFAKRIRLLKSATDGVAFNGDTFRQNLLTAALRTLDQSVTDQR
jgi:hypothetical protein